MPVLKKLMDARIKLHDSSLKKTGHNKFAGYHYFELGDFIVPIMQIMHKLNMAGFVSFGADLATLRIVDLDDNTEVSITSPMSSAALKGSHEVQNLGAVQTYLRRYLWVTAMEIVEHDALDAVTGAEVPKSAKPVAKATFDDMDADTQKFLATLADCVRNEFNQRGPEAAVKLLEEQGLDADLKVAMWSLFDSKERSAMKSVNQKKAA